MPTLIYLMAAVVLTALMPCCYMSTGAAFSDDVSTDSSYDFGAEEHPLDETVPDVQELPPGLTWVSIPAGSFEMGCSPGDAECVAWESPRHTVNVPTFRMTETEITQAQYEAVTGETPSGFTLRGFWRSWPLFLGVFCIWCGEGAIIEIQITSRFHAVLHDLLHCLPLFCLLYC